MTKSSAYVTRFLSTVLLFTVTAGIVGIITSGEKERTTVAVSAVESKPYVIVIDPGHGGEDPGASSESGVAEKDVNLKISLLCATLLKAAGTDVKLTRSDDRALYDMYDDLDDYTGRKKSYDLMNRLRFADDCNADLFVSIHLNKFFQPQCKGLQVYYSTNAPFSESVAQRIQNNVRQFFDPDNERQIKKATSAIYLLDNIKISAVLVECGFLSNPVEARDLCEVRYCLDLSAVLCSSLLGSVGNSKGSS